MPFDADAILISWIFERRNDEREREKRHLRHQITNDNWKTNITEMLQCDPEHRRWGIARASKTTGDLSAATRGNVDTKSPARFPGTLVAVVVIIIHYHLWLYCQTFINFPLHPVQHVQFRFMCLHVMYDGDYSQIVNWNACHLFPEFLMYLIYHANSHHIFPVDFIWLLLGSSSMHEHWMGVHLVSGSP